MSQTRMYHRRIGEGENLSFVLQSPECTGEEHAVEVPLKLSASGSLLVAVRVGATQPVWVEQ